mmetsp:Transcript_38579/g.110841  ORF Transcript_38579/g.110841 Transcript_38579/m.110841 type:complete len:229 (+) Transcript_38579:942-1628(+)
MQRHSQVAQKYVACSSGWLGQRVMWNKRPDCNCAGISSRCDRAVDKTLPQTPPPASEPHRPTSKAWRPSKRRGLARPDVDAAEDIGSIGALPDIARTAPPVCNPPLATWKGEVEDAPCRMSRVVGFQSARDMFPFWSPSRMLKEPTSVITCCACAACAIKVAAASSQISVRSRQMAQATILPFSEAVRRSEAPAHARQRSWLHVSTNASTRTAWHSAHLVGGVSLRNA